MDKLVYRLNFQPVNWHRKAKKYGLLVQSLVISHQITTIHPHDLCSLHLSLLDRSVYMWLGLPDFRRNLYIQQSADSLDCVEMLTREAPVALGEI